VDYDARGLDEYKQLRAERDRYRDRLALSPGGDDAIDGLSDAVSHLREAESRLTAERDAARLERDSGAGKVPTYSEPTGGGDFDELCTACNDPVSDPHTWAECARKLAAHRDHLLWFAATLEHERDAARLELNEATERARALEYAAGYAADLAAIDRVLDQHDAPHDCEDGVSLSPKRIRLLAEERDAARLELRALEWLTLSHDEDYPSDWFYRGDTVWTSDEDGDETAHATYASAARALGWEG
jgi:hypothetical protein